MPDNLRILPVLMLALFAWGVLHTVGVFLAEPDLRKAVLKAVIVAGAMAIFLGLWLLMLWFRGREDEENDVDA